VGPDTLFCTSIGDYTIEPPVLVNLIWEVPDNATIIGNVNDTAVSIDFGGESGMIYLLSVLMQHSIFGRFQLNKLIKK